MQTKCINVYQFSELSDKAKTRAIEQYRYINVEDVNWWDPIYEDAKNIGLQIDSFDLDRNKHANGVFTLSAAEVAANITRDHGAHCETYKAAEQFLAEHNPVFASYMDPESADFESRNSEDALSNIEDRFLKNLLRLYADMLQKDSEYLIEDAAVIETIEANEYEFTETGKRFNF